VTDKHDPGCPAECQSRLGRLENFEKNQTCPDGFNERMWSAIGRIDKKQTWMLGGLGVLCFVITVGVIIFGALAQHGGK
jgi:hypothetical protein